MGEREDHQASTESRRDVGARPPTRHGHEDQIQRFLGATLYRDLKDEQETDEERAAKARKAKHARHESTPVEHHEAGTAPPDKDQPDQG